MTTKNQLIRIGKHAKYVSCNPFIVIYEKKIIIMNQLLILDYYTGIFNTPYQLHQLAIQSNVMRTHSMVQGISSLNWENAHVGQLPKRVFIAMVDNDTYIGSIAKNPFNFKHFNASQVGIYLNGEMPSPPLKLNSTDNQYIVGIEVCLQQQGEWIWIMVWILQGLTINLVIVFLDSTHLPHFATESLKNGKEMGLCEQI